METKLYCTECGNEFSPDELKKKFSTQYEIKNGYNGLECPHCGNSDFSISFILDEKLYRKVQETNEREYNEWRKHYDKIL